MRLPSSATLRSALAFCSRRLELPTRFGDHEDHVVQFRQVLAALLPFFWRVLGLDHLDTLNIRRNLTLWTGKAGRRLLKRTD